MAKFNECMAKSSFLRWIYTNYHAYAETKAMYEKYDATIAGAPGRGGEYENQIGFGWTNGYVMDLLFKYGDQLIPPPPTRFSKPQVTTQEEESTTESKLEMSHLLLLQGRDELEVPASQALTLVEPRCPTYYRCKEAMDLGGTQMSHLLPLQGRDGPWWNPYIPLTTVARKR
uniref:Trehalase n=1 Tax=Timema poppense TaxID=170557 RepID=A0A7R9DJZ6_TIMPO|nr:unnamed protein product [Timema poppensis]